MDKEYFLFEDKIKEIESKFLLKNGWLKIHESTSIDSDDTSSIFCCLISNEKVEEFNKDYSWPLSMGREGKPAIYNNNQYKSNPIY